MRHKKSRFIYMVLVGIVISFLLDKTVGANPILKHSQLPDYLVCIVITILVWEGNLRIDDLMNRYFPWEKRPVKRIIVHLPVIVIFSAVLIYLSMLLYNSYVCRLDAIATDRFMSVATVIGVLISLFILSIEAGVRFFVNWKRSLVEIEKYKAESLQAQLRNLKDQINPHFLFNNMSVLSSLVYKDQDKAVDFINQLSKVYRYLLDSRNSELVSLQEELTFIHSYTYLLGIRFDKNLIFKITIPKEAESNLLPPMALQILMENAIKHNEISSELPLIIEVTVKDNKLVVKNNLQRRTDNETSCKTGLKNIRDRYKFFTDEVMEVLETEDFFTVKLPLLKSR